MTIWHSSEVPGLCGRLSGSSELQALAALLAQKRKVTPGHECPREKLWGHLHTLTLGSWTSLASHGTSWQCKRCKNRMPQSTSSHRSWGAGASILGHTHPRRLERSQESSDGDTWTGDTQVGDHSGGLPRRVGILESGAFGFTWGQYPTAPPAAAASRQARLGVHLPPRCHLPATVSQEGGKCSSKMCRVNGHRS